jgi:rsbT co-antagonist protein RsbR
LDITLINKDGLILSSPKREMVLRDRILLSQEQRQAIWSRTMDRTFGRMWFDPARLAGTAAFYGYSHYRGLGWIAIATQQRDEALAPVVNLWKGTLLIGLIVAVGIITLGAVASQVITRPLLALRRAVAQVSRGDLRQRVPITGEDEIGQLGTAFNHMVAQLEEAHHTLESRIEERTQNLQATLDALRTTLSERDMLSEQLRQSSVPLIPLLDRIAVLPIVGALDSDRLQRLQTRLLQGIEHERLRLVLLDITAVPVVDTHVALGLLHAAQAAQLLGCQVTLVGIRPEVAATIVQLGVTLHGMATHATLQSGLMDALRRSRQMAQVL